MKYISLGVMGEYKELETSLGHCSNVTKEIKKIDQMLEVDFFIDEKKKEECKISICNELSDMIINIIKNKTVKKK